MKNQIRKEQIEKLSKILEKLNFTNYKKGSHCKHFLGWQILSYEFSHLDFIRKKYGTLSNYVFLSSCDELKEKLTEEEFLFMNFKSTKSNRFCISYFNFI